MHPRLDMYKAAPDAVKAMLALEGHVRASGLDPHLLHLVKIRASQINGCAYCIDMHVKEALDDGEDPQRLHLLAAWRESPLFDARERAALRWTQALTLLPETGANDASYEEARAQFGEAELVRLSLAITTINGWNRLVVGFRAVHPKGMAARVQVR